MLKTALHNTRQLNRSLQTMLHSMEGFFGRLLEQTDYGALLGEHLNGYVEDVVGQKYHILKTGDNFTAIKRISKNGSGKCGRTRTGWQRCPMRRRRWISSMPLSGV